MKEDPWHSAWTKEDLEESQGTLCYVMDGKECPRIPFGSEKKSLFDRLFFWGNKFCSKCHAIKGQYHIEGCERERCPCCGCYEVKCNCRRESYRCE